MVQRPQTRCCGRQCSKEGGNTPHPRLRHCGTPRNHQNHRSTKQKLLVARHERLHHPIRQRVCPLSIPQKHHYTTQTPPIPHHNEPRSTTIQVHKPGLHHQATTI